jgi:hypothetical protein
VSFKVLRNIVFVFPVEANKKLCYCWTAFEGTRDHSAVADEFTMLEDEVESVIKVLVENAIEVVAVHNHMVHEQPRTFFLHYWGVKNAEQLAN